MNNPISNWLLGLTPLLLCAAAIADQTVITAYPNSGEFKFVWSDGGAVYKSKDGKTTVRCNFSNAMNGVDDDAEAYVGTSFLCRNGLTIILKQLKRNNDAVLFLVDKSENVLGTTSVNIDKKVYKDK
ncbi:TPA: hypothetical protein R4193_000835 [Serratia marcescens]|uniref:hypothetical protein n=1 Tax=Serratia marcescens TaxID=615 RepID=UPI001495FE30|nr:hypothetical protein [Serratia marcescens]EGT0501989.1 hypothetical protein [Serratia marcescens]EHT9831802.1 hypothetical protein [Serratia marcescens]EIU0973007.1 hypothetical protein [Serratia marcescens]EMB7752243.1 hypothetical protein [Serratia marcescens]MDP8628406.1 hypothetical protein [Serratia marcescens]